jgi:hypothetical protein
MGSGADRCGRDSERAREESRDAEVASSARVWRTARMPCLLDRQRRPGGERKGGLLEELIFERALVEHVPLARLHDDEHRRARVPERRVRRREPARQRLRRVVARHVIRAQERVCTEEPAGGAREVRVQARGDGRERAERRGDGVELDLAQAAVRVQQVVTPEQAQV